MIYTHKIQEAIDFATKVHEIDQKQKRKGKDIPYITHPLTVALILGRTGASEDLVIAGILHDTVEDSTSENIITLEMIIEQFGEGVSKLVESVTESDKSLKRKEEALKAISGYSEDSLLLKSADIIANVSELIVDYKRDGFRTFDRFNASGEQIVGRAREMIRLILKTWPQIPTATDLTSLNRELSGAIDEDESPFYYYYSNLHEKKVKVDTEKNIAFVKDEQGKAWQVERGNKVVTDALIENNKIKESDY